MDLTKDDRENKQDRTKRAERLQISAFVKKMLPSGAIFELKLHQNALLAGASPPNPTQEAHSAHPDPLAGFHGAALRQGSGGEERTGQGREGRKWEGRKGQGHSPTSFFTI